MGAAGDVLVSRLFATEFCGLLWPATEGGGRRALFLLSEALLLDLGGVVGKAGSIDLVVIGTVHAGVPGGSLDVSLGVDLSVLACFRSSVTTQPPAPQMPTPAPYSSTPRSCAPPHAKTRRNRYRRSGHSSDKHTCHSHSRRLPSPPPSSLPTFPSAEPLGTGSGTRNMRSALSAAPPPTPIALPPSS